MKEMKEQSKKIRQTGFLGFSLVSILMSIVFFFLGLTLSSCQQKSNEPPAPPPAGYAVTPQPCNYGNTYNQWPGYYNPNGSNLNCTTNNQNNPNCFPPYSNGTPNPQYPLCYTNNGVFSGNYGAWYFPTEWNYSNGYCGCQVGYYPVQSPSYGIACAPYSYFQNFAYQNSYQSSFVVTYNWNMYAGPSQNNQWVNIPQVPNIGTQQMNMSLNSCIQNTAQGCDVRVPTCPTGTTCQPIGGGSTLGLCVTIAY